LAQKDLKGILTKKIFRDSGEKSLEIPKKKSLEILKIILSDQFA